MVQLVYEFYTIIKTYLDEIVTDKWMGPNSKLAIVGGITINCDNLGTDAFLPLMFTLQNKNGDIEDVFDEVF